MIILGIESSCDETAVAVVQDGNVVLSSQVASQVDMHAVYGGVVPEVAAREHLRVIDHLVERSLHEAGVAGSAVDAIAVTQGPGLIGALLVGVAYAKGLALRSRKPLIPINHVHAHIHGALLGIVSDVGDLLPGLGYVVSGGHTNLYYMRSPVDFELMAYSIDDACGECFDKVAKIMHLGYPGGPAIERLARQGKPGNIAMPRMVERKSRLVFSYSGLKTHMVNLIAKQPDKAHFADICASFQDEALGQLLRKCREARNLHPDAKAVLVAGGVAANQRFRELMSAPGNLPACFPDLKFCSDNAAMIATNGYFEYKAAEAKGQLVRFADLSWDAYSRYPFATMQARV